MKYVFFDGDNVGKNLEILLNSNRLGEASTLSENIKIALTKIEKKLLELKDINIIILGGDDVLIGYESGSYDDSFLNEIAQIFKIQTGLSMSFGTGSTVFESINNLHFSKRFPGGTSHRKTDKNLTLFMENQTVLYIFAASPRPDVYINVISHCIYEYKPVKIVFIDFEKDRGRWMNSQKELGEIQERVIEQFSALKNGEYVQQVQGKRNDWETIDIDITINDRNRYGDIQERASLISFDTKLLYYYDAEVELSKIIDKDRKEGYRPIFDISAALKEHLIEVYMILLSRKVQDIFSFQLLLDPSHGKDDLIHKLKFEHTYRYVPVAKTNFTSDKKVLTKRDEKARDSTLYFQDQLAESFAVYCMTLVWIIFILPASGLVAWHALRSWDTFEKWTVIIPVVFFYAINFIIQAIFGRNLSFSPQNARKTLKSWKLNRLQKTFDSALDTSFD